MRSVQSPLEKAAAYGTRFRETARPLHPTATAQELRRAFCAPLQDAPADGGAVIDQLIAAAEPGLVGNTDPNFFAWVMGGSDTTGVAADWLTSIWGQNAAIYQTAPAAAIAEEAVSAWVLDLLDLPCRSSVGLVTGATMATFVGLAAGRSELLRREGYDLEAQGLFGAPRITVLMSDDAHVANHSALRMLGFGAANIRQVPSDDNGLMRMDAFRTALRATEGPVIVIAQAGHINSGGFEEMDTIARLVADRNAWVHVDGAFGLWARVLTEKAALTRGFERADSWSVDGHKWLQVPYELGFAIVRHPEAHRRAMDASAPYLNHAQGDGRNPTEFNPELSRRARGFAAWAVLKTLGRDGVKDLIRRHCAAARATRERLRVLPQVTVLGTDSLNQVIFHLAPDHARGRGVAEIVARLNAEHGVFVKETVWKGKPVARLSFSSGQTGSAHAARLAAAIDAVTR